MSGTGWTRRLKSGNGNVEETHPELRAGDPNAADACLSCLGPAAPRAREGVNVLRSRNTIFSYVHVPRKGRADCQAISQDGDSPQRCASNEQRQVVSLTSPRARCCVMGGEARLGVYLSPSTNYERRILEDAFDGCVPRPSPRATSIDRSIDRSIPETPKKDADTPPPRPTRFRASQARRVAQGRG